MAEHTDEIAPPVRTGYTPCDWPGCEHSIVNGWALFRVNPTGQRGIFMCSEHAGASPEEVADLMDAVADHFDRRRPSDG